MKKTLTTLIILTTLCGHSQVPSWLHGTWTGEIFQANAVYHQYYTIEITCNENECTVKYSSLDCSGDWRHVKGSKGKVFFRETISDNTTNCLQEVDVLIRKKKSHIKYKSKDGDGRGYDCKGKLKKIKPRGKES